MVNDRGTGHSGNFLKRSKSKEWPSYLYNHFDSVILKILLVNSITLILWIVQHSYVIYDQLWQYDPELNNTSTGIILKGEDTPSIKTYLLIMTISNLNN